MVTDEREVPEVERSFAILLRKYGVGVGKSPIAETIAESISRTGGEFVYEEPEKLAERLATWHDHITPTKRKQILEHWFAVKGIEVPQAETTNYILTGAKVAQLLIEGQKYRDKAKELLTNITPKLSPSDIGYILWRIEEEIH